MSDLRDDKPLWGLGEVLRLALPAALGMINTTIMQFVDGVMVARMLGPTALAATFVAGILSFVPISLATGIFTVVNTFVAQNLGAGRASRCGRYTWQGLYLAAAFSLLLTPLAVFSQGLFEGLAGLIVRFQGSPTDAAELAYQTVYFRILVAGAALRLLSSVLEQHFYGTQRPSVVYAATLVGLVVNTGMNYVLIQGLWVFPRMGLAGAAVGTLLGWGAGLAFLAVKFLGPAQHRRFLTRATWALRPRLARDILRIGMPTGVQFCNDVTAWAIFNAVLVGYFGAIHKAASAAAVRYLFVSFMPAVGVGVACTALVGNYIGAGRPELGRRRVHAALVLAITYMGLCGLGFFLFRYPLIRLFVRHQASALMSPAQFAEIVRIGATVMICAAVFQCFDAVGIVYVGALRGAGDTFWPMVITITLSWGVTVGGGMAMMHLAPFLGSVGPWVAAAAYVIMLGLILTWRFESGAWREIDLLGRARVKVQPTAAGASAVAAGASRSAEPETES